MSVTKKEWMFDEFQHSGVDYSDDVTAARYDGRHENFRDFQAETEQIVQLLGIGSDDCVIDLGAGTGGITAHLAKHVRQVYAVDVSSAMLERCREKCTEAGADNVQYCRGGFLTYEHEGEKADVIISQVALHHLPDMWKQVAMNRCFEMLKGGGVFWLLDVVFSFDFKDYEAAVQEWVDWHVQHVGPEAAVHIRDEYSTMDWVMEGILKRAGFQIERIESKASFLKGYICRKPL